MEKAMLKQLLEAAVHAHRHHVVGVDADAPHRFEVGELHPIDPFHGQHPPAGGMAIDGGYGDAGIGAMEAGKGFGVAGLIAVIHLLKHPLAQFVDQGDEVAADQADVAVQPGGDVAHDVEIERDLLAQTGPLNLDGHHLTGFEHPLVHLPQGGCGDGFAIELFVNTADRGAEVFLDAGHGQGAVETRQLVLKLGELLEQHRRHDVGPGGEGLACLDEGGPQIHEQFGGFLGPLPGSLLVF